MNDYPHPSRVTPTGPYHVTGLQPRIRCPECGLPVPDVPEGAQWEELLCNKCYEAYEKRENIEGKLS